MNWFPACLSSVTVLALSAPLQAQNTTGFTPLFNGAYIVQVIASFLLVMGALLGVLWLLRRFSGGIRQRPATLQVVASVGLGGREKAVLLQAGEQQLLLGVASGKVSLLHTFDQALVDGQQVEPTPFGATLRAALGQREV